MTNPIDELSKENLLADKVTDKVTELLKEFQNQVFDGENLVATIYKGVSCFTSQTNQNGLMCDLIRLLAYDVHYELTKHPKLR